MPWTIIACLPGGALGKVRQRYAVVQKLLHLQECDCLRQVHGLSLCQAAADLHVPVCLLSKWTKELPRLQAHARMKKCAITPRGKDQLHPIEDELLMWIFSRCEQGLSIRNTIDLLKASGMLRDTFGTKSKIAWLKAVACFMRKDNYVYCQKTNKATHAPQEVYAEAQEFLEFTRPLLLGPHCNWRWIFNIDQLPLYFLTTSRRLMKSVAPRPFSSARCQMRQR
jgi:hypothetical protein